MLTQRPKSATLSVVSPGRVNLLGEHVDYNGGVVLPAAIDRTVKLLAEPLEEKVVVLTALDLGREVCIRLDDLDRKIDAEGSPLSNWALYPAGVAWAAYRRGLPVKGIRAEFHSDVPIGAGLSSSAAVEVAFGALWRHLGGWQIDNLELAQLCQQAENEYVGVKCGLMDQFACACGVDGHALYLDTRNLEWRPIRLPENTAIVIANSGVRRSLADSAYNDRRAACELAVRLFSAELPGISSLRDVRVEEFRQYRHLLPEIAAKRAQHVVEEIDRVEAAMVCLEHGDAACFGRLMFAAHESLRDLYEVSVAELDRLVEIAAGLSGCYGARLTGAGFGGCTINLVSTTEADSFIQRLRLEYARQTGREVEIYLCRASQGVTVSELPG